MKKLIACFALSASIALASEDPLIQLAGTNTQSGVVGRGNYISVQCTTPVRYQTAGPNVTPTLSANNVLIAVGDPYRIKLYKAHDRIFLAHQDLATAIDCKIFAVVE